MFRADVNNITRKADVLGFYANGGGRKQHIIFPTKTLFHTGESFKSKQFYWKTVL